MLHLELSLTLAEVEWLKRQAKIANSPDLIVKVERAVRKAESKNRTNHERSRSVLMRCAGCDGSGFITSFGPAGYLNSIKCYYCSGTGKEWV